MPVVPTVSGRQVESRGVQSAGLQTFSQPGISDAFVRAVDLPLYFQTPVIT